MKCDVCGHEGDEVDFHTGDNDIDYCDACYEGMIE